MCARNNPGNANAVALAPPFVLAGGVIVIGAAALNVWLDSRAAAR